MPGGEHTGPHPLPPLVGGHPPGRGSDPPISAKGVSWKVVGTALGFLFTAATTIGTVVYTQGVERAEQRAEARSTREALAAIRADQRVQHLRIERSEARLAGHDTQIGIVERDVREIGHELDELERREAQERRR
jgi:hypothetical protein